MIALRTLRFGLGFVACLLVACLAAGACDEPEVDDEEDEVEVQGDDVGDPDAPVGAAPPPGVPEDVPIPPGSTLPGTSPPAIGAEPIPAPPEVVSSVDVPPEITGGAVPSPDTQGGASSADTAVAPAPGGATLGEFMWAEDADVDADAGLEAGAPL